MLDHGMCTTYPTNDWVMKSTISAINPANSLLAQLGGLENGEEVRLQDNTEIYSENRIDYLYFPINALVSISSGGVEVSMVDNDDVLGVTAVLGLDEPIGKHRVVIPGKAWRVPVATVISAVQQQPAMATIFNRLAGALVAQVIQDAACSRLHTIKQRCARWLLMADRCVRSEKLAITQERLADLLSVRRATVNPTLVQLRMDGSIQYRRGVLRIIDPQRLAAAACECYRTTG